MILTLARTWSLAVGIALVVGTAFWAVASRRAATWRSAGLGIVLVGASSLIYEGLCQAGLLRETFVRFRSPLGLLAVAAVSVLVGLRVSRLSRRMTALRRGAVALFSSTAALAATFVLADPELGRPSIAWRSSSRSIAPGPSTSSPASTRASR